MSRSKPTLLPLVIFTLAALAFASGASAATPGRFGCRASAVRGAISSPASTFEPTVASTSGCTDASAANARPRSSGPIQIGVAGAFVHGQRRREAPGAASLASLTGVTISSATHHVVIGSAQS